MCGITGVYSLNDSKINKDLLLRMNNKIRHRGPDDEGYFISNTREGLFNFASGEETQVELKSSLVSLEKSHSGNLGFGFRRLSIQDLSENGHQPMSDVDQRAVIIFNGEIYNFIELREELKSKGYKFKSLTDTEVILNAYLEWGEDCVQYFNGMWAFALWDIACQKLFCSRDRFGIKPFYYFEDSLTFMFASEIKALLEDVPAEINKNTLYKYLYADEIDTSNETFFTNITQLSPGHSLTIENGCLQQNPYYCFKEKITLSTGSYIRKFKEEFKQAVQLRLRSDVAVGFALSGGIDSSSIVGMASAISGKEKKDTFSIVYPETEIDESIFIDAVIEKTKFNNHKLSPNERTFKKDLEDFIYCQEEPVPDLSYYNEYKLRSFIKEKKIVVSLEGQGADEIVTGYRSFVLPFYFDLINHFRWKRLIREMSAFKGLYPVTISQVIIRYFASKLPQKFLNIIKKIRWRMQDKLVNPSYFKGTTYSNNSRFSKSNLNSALMNSLRLYSIPKQLNRADKSAMSFSIECRFPFLDHNLVEYAYKLPDDQKMNNGITKKILRLAMKDQLPQKIFERKDKKGFLSPQSTWIRDLKDIFDPIVYSEEFKKCGYVNWDKFEKKYSDFISKRHNDSKEIWKILSVFLWERTFIQNQNKG